jgi:hypothetical protein
VISTHGVFLEETLRQEKTSMRQLRVK